MKKASVLRRMREIESGSDIINKLLEKYQENNDLLNYQVVFRDPLEISEYFYSFRKKWDDCKYRIFSNQFSSYSERLSLIK